MGAVAAATVAGAEPYAFDAATRTLEMTVQPLLPSYDEAALLVHGWGVLAGCKGLRRLVVTVEEPSEPSPSD